MTWKKALAYHPLMGFVNHGSGGSGEPVAALLWPANASSNFAAAELELAQLPKTFRRGRQTLMCTDSGCGTCAFLAWFAPAPPIPVLPGNGDAELVRVSASWWRPSR